MTPAINLLEQRQVEYQLHRYAHKPGISSYGLEAAEQLGIDSGRIFKTLVVELDGQELAVGMVPVTGQLATKRMAKALGAKRASMAKLQKVTRSTGYVLGGVSPLGQKRALRTVLDRSAQNYPTIFVSAGQRGLEIEIAPDTLLQLCNGDYADIAQD